MRRSSASWFGWWADSVALSAQAPGVIGLRLMKIARGGGAADAEIFRMIAEKGLTALAAQQAILGSLLTGNPYRATSKVTRLYRRNVRANLNRLTKRR